MARSLRTVVSHLLAVISDTSVSEPYGGDLTRGSPGGRASGSHPYPRHSVAATCALLVVLVWVGLWLLAIDNFLTGWYWNLTGREASTAWLLLPLCGPVPYAVGTPVPAVAATMVLAVGLTVSGAVNPP